jgi:hypothetical protein
MARFRIGTFEFISLSRALSRPVQQIEREVRPGFDGVSFWRSGVRSEPMPLTSVADCPTVSGGLGLLTAYETLVGGDPVPVTWADLELPELLVFVHAVLPLDHGLHATLLGIGGLNGVSRGLLRCVWIVETIDPFG